MINYADYDFYTNEYKGSLSIDLFNSLIIKASREIDKNVNKDLTETNIERLTEREQWQLKYVACELCDFLNNSGGNSCDGPGHDRAPGIGAGHKAGSVHR